MFEYVPSLAKKERLDLDTLLPACAALSVIVVERSEYEGKLSTVEWHTTAELLKMLGIEST